jgi:hypothetical protein
MVIFGGSADANTFILDDNSYTLVEVKGTRQWLVDMIPNSVEVRVPLQLYGGFGASYRFTNVDTPTDPTHHEYSENMFVGHAGEITPAQRITYLDLSTLGARSAGFQMGGTADGRLGGGLGWLGGGIPLATPESIRLFGDYLYSSGASHTHVIDPAASTPDLKETKYHGNAAKARSSDIYNSALYVALGQGKVAVRANQPWSTEQTTDWENLDASSDVLMNVFQRGKAGRLYSAGGANGDLLFVVNPGDDPDTLASYVPSAGEPVGDATHPITALNELNRAIVSAKEDNLLFLDPDAGFYSRPILPEIAGYPSEFSGRGMFAAGTTLFLGTKFGYWMLQEGRTPIQVGPELLTYNKSPYIDPQWGKGVSVGLHAYIPAYFPSSGDSVIFVVRRRQPGEPGTGPLIWNEYLFLENRECRVVSFWPGTSSVNPRLFFGAGSSVADGNVEQVGWIQFSKSGLPDHPNDSGNKPTLSATIYGPADDLGAPGITDELKRIELPRVRGVDSSNYFVVSVSADYGSSYTDLVQANDGTANDERVVSTGFRQVFPPISTPIANESLKVKIAATQASAATDYAAIQGIPTVVLRRQLQATQQITALIKAEESPSRTLEDIQSNLQALVDGNKIQVRDAPGDSTFWAEVNSVRIIELENRNPDSMDDIRAVQLIMTEVSVDA